MKFGKKQILDENGHIRNTSIWQIEVDYNNSSDIQAIIRKLKSRIGELDKNGRSRKQLASTKFRACCDIYATDISDLYVDQKLDSSPNYYVYAHCEPNKIAIERDGVATWVATLGLDLIPFYIGKGTGNRAYDLNRNETHKKVRQKLKNFGQEVEVRIIKDGLTEIEALCLESKLIDMFGLLGKGGRLVNLDEGVKAKERQNRYKDKLTEINDFYKNSLKVEV